MSDDRYDNHRYHNADTFNVQSTAGAVPVRNKKGELSMQKVKVSRYISGKRPEYAGRGSSDEDDEESEEEDFVQSRRRNKREWSPDVAGTSQVYGGDGEPATRFGDGYSEAQPTEQDVSDPRIRRLMAAKQSGGRHQRARRRHGSDDAAGDSSDDEDDRVARHRRIHEPEVLSDGDDGKKKDDDDEDEEDMDTDSSAVSSGEDDMDEEAIQRRRDLMRQRALAKAQIGLGPEEVMEKEEEREAAAGGGGGSEESDETSEEETSDSDEEEGARLKPVFVRKGDRLTIQEREREEAKEREAERQAQIQRDQRKKETMRMVETLVKTDIVERKAKDNDPLGMNEVNTDDENEEVEYEAWKLRELKRLKRDREEREARQKEVEELEEMRNMTEEERRALAKNNPKIITNKAVKGKYKFMQKYYHRGAFFLEEEEGIYKRDVSQATLEDRFDKTVLPKVMQVKNFGRSGRTKYTHLVDQDTTEFDSPWQQQTAQGVKFHAQHAGGMKQVFTKPSKRKKVE